MFLNFKLESNEGVQIACREESDQYCLYSVQRTWLRASQDDLLQLLVGLGFF